MHPRSVWSILFLFLCTRCAADDALRVGMAGHAFDHLGSIGEQAEAAAASGATIIYATGPGGFGYGGLPAEDELTSKRRHMTQYSRQAKERGIRLVIGYVRATTIVKLDT